MRQLCDFIKATPRYRKPKHAAVDCSRHRVPDHLKTVFHGRQRMVEWATHVAMLQSEAAEWMREGYADALDFRALMKELELLRMRVLHAAPNCVCGCKPNSQCEHCGGKGWFTTEEYLRYCAQKQRRKLKGFWKIGPQPAPPPEASEPSPKEQSAAA